MPELTGPLLSLRARGAIGGHRKVPTTRIEYSVLSFPTSSITSTIATTNVVNNTFLWFLKFYLPFHLTVHEAVVYASVATTPSLLRYGIYNEEANKLLVQGVSAAAPSNAAYHRIPMGSALRLAPGAYYQAIMPVTSQGTLNLMAPTMDDFNAYTIAAAGIAPMFAGRYTVPNAGLLPVSIDLFGSSRFDNMHIQARLQ